MSEELNNAPSAEDKEKHRSDVLAEAMRRIEKGQSLDSESFELPEQQVSEEIVEADPEEEEVDEPPEEESEEEVEYDEGEEAREPEVVPAKKTKAERDLSKRQYQMIADLQKREQARERDLAELRSQAERFRNERDTAIKTSNYHFEDASKTKLEKLNALYNEAVQKSDSDLLLKVLDERANVIAEMREVDNLRRAYERDTQYDVPEVSQAPAPQAQVSAISPIQEQKAALWHKSQAELQEDHPSFNQKLWDSTYKFAAKLNQDLVNAGQVQQIYSNEYMDVLNGFLQGEKARLNPAKRKVSTMPAHAPVASAQNSGLRAPVKPSRKVEIEPHQRDWVSYIMARDRITQEAAEAKYKTAIMKSQKDRESGVGTLVY